MKALQSAAYPQNIEQYGITGELLFPSVRCVEGINRSRFFPVPFIPFDIFKSVGGSPMNKGGLCDVFFGLLFFRINQARFIIPIFRKSCDV